MVGTIWLLPKEHVPHGSWLIAVGAVLLGLNVARVLNGLRMSGFSMIIGVIALITGLDEFFEIGVPLFPIALIVIGAYVLLKNLFFRDSTSTGDDHWSYCGDGR